MPPSGDAAESGGDELLIRVLGPLEVVSGGRPLQLGPPKARALFAYLALNAGLVVSDGRLTEVLWGTAPPASAGHALQVYVARLRSALDPGRQRGDQDGLLRTRPPGYQLAVDGDSVDAHRFEILVRQGRSHLTARRFAEAAAVLKSAGELWRGPAFADLEALHGTPEAVRLEELRTCAVEDRIDAELALSRHRDVLHELVELTVTHPLRERLCGQLMVALYRCGQQTQALATFTALRERLDEDGLVPGPELRVLEVAVLRHDDHLTSPTLTDVPVPVAAPALADAPVSRAPAVAVAPRTPGDPPVAGLATTARSSLVWAVTVVHVRIDVPAHPPDADLDAALSEVSEHVVRRLRSTGGHLLAIDRHRVTAVYGIPAPHEDDVERAVRTALDTLADVDRLGRELVEVWDMQPPTARVGVCAGLPLTDEGAPEDFGDLTRQAAILATGAPPRQVIIAEGAYRLVQARFEWSEAHGTGHRPLAPRTDTGNAPGAPGRMAPLIGRARELDGGLTVLDRASHGGGGLLWITGEVGVGKTRLISELRQEIERRGSRVRWLQGNCLPYPGVAHWPLREILHAWLGTTVRSPGPQVRARLRIRLAELADPTGATTAGSDAVPVLEYERIRGDLAALLGLPRHDMLSGVWPAPSPQAMEQAAVAALHHVLAGLARQGPIVVAVEDLHWADAGSLHLLQALLPLVESTGIAVVITQRPERSHHSWQLYELAQRTFPHRITHVAIAPLDSGWDDALLTALTQDGPISPQLRTRLLAAAEGNPFYLEELVRTVRTATTSSVDIPPSVEQVLGSRIATLSQPAQDLLAAAAAIGRRFSLDLLLGVADLETAPIDLIAELNAQGWLTQTRGWPTPEYEFRHALSHDAAYRRVWPPRRVQLHRRAATLLETTVGDQAGNGHDTLAWHWGQAGDRDRAMRHHLLAARAALSLHALDVATHHFTEGLRAAEHLGEQTDSHTRNDLLLGLAQVGRLSGEGDAEGLLTQALQAATRTSDDVVTWQARYELGYWLGFVRGRQTEARASFQAAADAAHRCGDIPGQVRSMAKISLLLANDLDLVGALAQADSALTAARATGDDRAVASALDARKLSALYLGQLAALEELLPNLETTLRNHDDMWTLQFVLAEGAAAAAAAGHWDDATAHWTAADEANHRCGDRVSRPFIVTTRVAVEHRQGAYGTALAAAADAVTGEDGAWWTPWARTDLGALLLDLYDAPSAVEHLQLASDQAMFPAQQVRSLAHLAHARWMLGQRRPAVAALEQAAAMIAAISVPPGGAYLFGADATFACTRVRLDLGQPDRANDLLDPVLHAAQITGCQGPLAQGLLLAARCRRATGDLDQAHLLAERALALADKLCLPAVTWRAHALLSGLTGTHPSHAAAACRIITHLSGSLPDPVQREAFQRQALLEATRLAGGNLR